MKPRNPRSGTMQFWPRKRAKRETPRVRAWTTIKEAKPLAFAGYKAGMTHVLATDNRKTSTSKGQDVVSPVTIIECPPVRIYAVRGYKAQGYGTTVAKELIVATSKDLERKLTMPKSVNKLDDFKADDYTDITIQVFTQPKKMGFKKKPDVLEVHLGGSNEEKLAFIKEHIDKEIAVADIFAEGELVDLHAITTGKGFQGAVKRFGIGLKSHKSEKGRRAPGSLGGWKAQAHVMYRVAHAGQTGYHQRVQYNNMILKIGDLPEEVNPKGGLVNYGEVKNTYVLIKGTVPGPKKRIIVFTKAIRAKKHVPAPTVKAISTKSKQGR